MLEGFMGNTGLCSLEISRSSKGDYSYSIKTYFSAKGRAPEAAIDRADRLRLAVEKRLGLRPEEADVEIGAAFAAVYNRLGEIGQAEVAKSLFEIFSPSAESRAEQMEGSQAKEDAKKGKSTTTTSGSDKTKK